MNLGVDLLGHMVFYMGLFQGLPNWFSHWWQHFVLRGQNATIYYCKWSLTIKDTENCCVWIILYYMKLSFEMLHGTSDKLARQMLNSPERWSNHSSISYKVFFYLLSFYIYFFFCMLYVYMGELYGGQKTTFRIGSLLQPCGFWRSGSVLEMHAFTL